jgi:lysophospholipid acyltransferase (LPLAT)-like uncharacterized protein
MRSKIIYFVAVLSKPEIQIILTLPDGSEGPLVRVSLGVTRLSAEVVINLQALAVALNRTVSTILSQTCAYIESQDLL